MIYIFSIASITPSLLRESELGPSILMTVRPTLSRTSRHCRSVRSIPQKAIMLISMNDVNAEALESGTTWSTITRREVFGVRAESVFVRI